MKQTLFEAVQGSDGVRVVQPDADHVDVELLIDGTCDVARLTTVQAVALAIAILAANPGHTMHQGERLDDVTASMLGQAFLIPVGRRALARQYAAESALMPEAN